MKVEDFELIFSPNCKTKKGVNEWLTNQFNGQLESKGDFNQILSAVACFRKVRIYTRRANVTSITNPKTVNFSDRKDHYLDPLEAKFSHCCSNASQVVY